MHEISVCQSMLKTLESELGNEQMSNLKTIKLKVGEISGIEIPLLESAFAAVTEGSKYEKLSMEIQGVPVKAYCSNCQKDFRVYKHRFICPICDTPSADIVSGEELLIHQVIYED